MPPAWSDRRLGSTARPRHCTMCFLARTVRDLVRSLDGSLCNGTPTAPQGTTAAPLHHRPSRPATENPFRASKNSGRQPSAGNQRADGGCLVCVDSWPAWGCVGVSNRRRKRPCKRPLRMCAWHRMRSLAAPDAPRPRPSELHWRAPCLRMPSIESQPSCRRPSAAADSLRPQIRRRHAARLILAPPL